MTSRIPCNRYHVPFVIIFILYPSCFFHVTTHSIQYGNSSGSIGIRQMYGTRGRKRVKDRVEKLLNEALSFSDTEEQLAQLFSPLSMTESQSSIDHSNVINQTFTLSDSLSNTTLTDYSLLTKSETVENGRIATKDSNGLKDEVQLSAKWNGKRVSDSSQDQIRRSIKSGRNVSTKQTKIINGRSTSRSSYPFIVRLHSHYPDLSSDVSSSSSFFCGGTLISPDIVLTAAHCIGQEAYVDIFSLQDNEVKIYQILKSVVHPMYESEQFGYDFALIQIEKTHVEVVTETKVGFPTWRLSNNFHWTSQPPIMRIHRYSEKNDTHVLCAQLTQMQLEDVTNLIVLGFGLTTYPDSNGVHSFSSLKVADVGYVPNDICNFKYLKSPTVVMPLESNQNIITDEMLCAQDIEEKQDACSGDSGGPLLARLSIIHETGDELWTLIGIVSWGLGCALPEYPGVYSRIAKEVDWIDNTVCVGVNALSPLSCIDIQKGERRLRDYAVEAFSSNPMKEDVDKMFNVGGIRNGEIPLNKAHSPAIPRKRKRVHMNLSYNAPSYDLKPKLSVEACELLEGQFAHDVSASKIEKSNVTMSPNPLPTDHDKPIKVSLNILIKSCPKMNKSDIQSFFLTKGNKIANCQWVKRNCWKRCIDYADCCPNTCKERSCQ